MASAAATMEKVLAFLQEKAGVQPTVVVLVVLALTLLAFFGLPTGSAPVSLDKKEWRDFELIEIEKISHDVRRFRFKLPSKEHVLGLPVGAHVSFQFKDNSGNEVKRSYTPISSDDDKGFADFIIKVYNASKRELVDKDTKAKKIIDIPGGKMSVHLDSLKIGDKISMRGPHGELLYLGKGKFNIKSGKYIRTFKKLGLISGGSGITPILQLMRAIAKDPRDKTQVSLIFANVSEEDILLEDELTELAADPRFNVFFTVDRLKNEKLQKEWNDKKRGVGFVNKEMIEKQLPKMDDDTFYIACGPPPMYKFAVLPNFFALGICSEEKTKIDMAPAGSGGNPFKDLYEDGKNYFMC